MIKCHWPNETKWSHETKWHQWKQMNSLQDRDLFFWHTKSESQAFALPFEGCWPRNASLRASTLSSKPIQCKCLVTNLNMWTFWKLHAWWLLMISISFCSLFLILCITSVETPISRCSKDATLRLSPPPTAKATLPELIWILGPNFLRELCRSKQKMIQHDPTISWLYHAISSYTHVRYVSNPNEL